MISDGVLERLTVQITGDLDGLNDAAARVNTSVGRMTSDIEKSTGRIGGSLGKIGPLVSGAIGGLVAGFAVEGVQAVGQFAQATLNAADDIGDLAQRLGVTTDAVQELNGIFVAAGGSPKLMTEAMDQLNQRLGEFTISGKGPAADAFKQLGIDADITSGQIKGGEEAFYAIVKSIENVKDPAERARLSMELFGKSAGKDMVEVLGAGSAAMEAQRAKMRELGLVMDEDLIAKTANAKLTIDKATFAIGQWATVGMATAITKTLEFGTAVGTAWGAMSRFVSDTMTAVGSLYNSIVNGFNGIVGAFQRIGGQIVAGLVAGITGGVQAAANAAARLAQQTARAAKDALGIKSPSRVFMNYGEMIGEGLAIGIKSKQGDVSGAVESLANIAAQLFPKSFGSGTKGGNILGALGSLASIFSGRGLGSTPSFNTPGFGGGSVGTMTLHNYLGNELLDSRVLKLSSGAAVQSFQASRAQVPVDMGRANRNRIW
jgi:phage-related minor tail protein